MLQLPLTEDEIEKLHYERFHHPAENRDVCI